ncbi:hypothetical protein EIP91_005578 [Steccherinum ochraceum]|uniref:Peptidase S26 domain-containing protein n=1 Tax=Steccherinum ochraceum TaxID=92696 RepID=A0A4R0RVZ3_9APHY|nr:hypothetical protein EIP91_005578 [Steccherinum ochraceum]
MLRIWRTVERTRPYARGFALSVFGVLNFVCATHLFVQHVGWIHSMSGPSMLPTLGVQGEWVIESRVVDPHKLSRGDLVIYASPIDPNRLVCKRILGLPGDTVCVDPTGIRAPSTEHVIVPKGHFWMIGDNAEFSRDSRFYGPVSMGLVAGKLVARVWPLRSFTVFRSNFENID